MRKLDIVIASSLTLLLTVSLSLETSRVTVISAEGYDTTSTFETKAGCITTLVQVALDDHQETNQASGATTLRQTGTISLTQFSDPENGQDPQTGEACPALLLQEVSVALGPQEGASLEIDPALEKARFTGQALVKDYQGNDQLLHFDVLWQAVAPLKTGHRVDNRQDGKTTVRTIYKTKTRKAVAYGFMAHCDLDQDGLCSSDEEQAAVNYLNIPSQGEETFIRWQKIRTTVGVE